MANAAIQLTDTLRSRFDLPVGFRNRLGRSALPSGVHSVDQLLNGGFPRAAISEISGTASSNRTALVVSAVSRAVETGECCAWIDGGGTFDPESAAEAGLRLEGLLWIDCRGNSEHALKATDLLLHGGGFGVMVLDVAEIPDTILRRIPMASWFRLRRAAEETGTALIVLTPSPQTRSCSAVCVELTRRKSVWRGRLFRGIASVLETRKHFASREASFESVL